MSRVLSTFLCLGWCLCWSVWAQLGNLPKPQVTAVPGPLVLKMTPVTIKCQAPPGTEAEAFRIQRGGSSEPLNTEQGSYAMKEGMLQIPQMTTDRAGPYHCFYQHAGQQSLVSDTLTLVMTGAYDKPSLSSMTDSVEASVTVGTDVILRCFSSFMFDEFVLSREDGGHPNRYQNATLQGHSGRQAIFPLVNITSTQSGTYRCYGRFHENPHVWSNPSEPLKLEVREAPEQTCPTEPKHTTNCEHFDSSESGMTPGSSNYPKDPGPVHPTKAPEKTDSTEPKHITEDSGNSSSAKPTQATELPGSSSFLEKHRDVLIGVSVAAVLLLLLLFFLIHRCKAKRKGRQSHGDRQIGGQVFEAKDPEEVTYSQVTCTVPTQGSGAARLMSTQTCEYVTLAVR